MPIQTDLSVSPYFDDYDDQKDFYKILFRPGVAVQARELNQLQTILQKQIERFGNHVFKQGTIIDGSISHSMIRFSTLRYEILKQTLQLLMLASMLAIVYVTRTILFLLKRRLLPLTRASNLHLQI